MKPDEIMVYFIDWLTLIKLEYRSVYTITRLEFHIHQTVIMVIEVRKIFSLYLSFYKLQEVD